MSKAIEYVRSRMDQKLEEKCALAEQIHDITERNLSRLNRDSKLLETILVETGEVNNFSGNSQQRSTSVGAGSMSSSYNNGRRRQAGGFSSKMARYDDDDDEDDFDEDDDDDNGYGGEEDDGDEEYLGPNNNNSNKSNKHLSAGNVSGGSNAASNIPSAAQAATLQRLSTAASTSNAIQARYAELANGQSAAAKVSKPGESEDLWILTKIVDCANREKVVVADAENESERYVLPSRLVMPLVDDPDVATARARLGECDFFAALRVIEWTVD